MRIVSAKVVEKIKICFVFSNFVFFPKIVPFVG